MTDFTADGLTALLARPGVKAALAALDAPGEETRLVGGCVRDALLGVSASDIDLATTLRPDSRQSRPASSTGPSPSWRRRNPWR